MFVARLYDDIHFPRRHDSMRRREAPLGEIFGHVEPADVDFLAHLGSHQRLDHSYRVGAVLHLRAELSAKARIPVQDEIDVP